MGARVHISKLSLAPRRAARILGQLSMVAVLAGCTGLTPVYRDVAPITGPTPYVNRTPMHAALLCVRKRVAAAPDIRFGVADFVDGTGATMGDSDVNGRYFSQRPDLMLVVALSKAGVHLVNRSSTGVAEWEMKQAMDKRLGDGKPTMVGNTRFDYRPVRAGEFLGSNYYIHGAITEINWNLSSDANEVGAFGLTAGRRTYRVSMAIDLVVSNSTTTEVVFARSYSKQLVGYETGAGVFRFVNAAVMPSSAVELFQANLGQKQNEPVQQALRWLVETAGYDIVSQVYGRDAACDGLVPGAEPSDDRDPGLEIAPVVQQPAAQAPAQPSAQQSAPMSIAKPVASMVPPAPVAPVAPMAPVASVAPMAPVASVAPKVPVASVEPKASVAVEPPAPPKTAEWTRPQYSVGASVQPEPGRPEDARAVILRRDPAVQATPRQPLPVAGQTPAATQVRDIAPRRPVAPADDAPVIAPQTSISPDTSRGFAERTVARENVVVRQAPVEAGPALPAPVSPVAFMPPAALPVADMSPAGYPEPPAALAPHAAADAPDVQVGHMVAATFAAGIVEPPVCTSGLSALRAFFLAPKTASVCPAVKPPTAHAGSNA